MPFGGIEPLIDVSGNKEYERLLKSREYGFSRMMNQLAMGEVVHSQMPMMSPQLSFELAGPLSRQQNEGLIQMQDMSLRDMRSQDELIGAARFYGIDDAERMNPEDLLRIVEQRRSSVRNWAEQRDYTTSGLMARGFANAIALLGTSIPQQTARAAENLVAHIPFMKDVITRSNTVREADRWFSQLQEGVTADLPEERRRLARGVAGAVGYAAPAAAAWQVFGALGILPSSAVGGSAVIPVARGALRGALSEMLIHEPDAPLQEQAISAGLGAVLGGGAMVEGMLGRSIVGGGLGGIAGSLAGDGDPRATLIGVAGGATGFALLPWMLMKAQRSFPTMSFGGIDAEPLPLGERAPIIDADIVPDPFAPLRELQSGPRRLGPGSSINDAPQGPLPPPDAPAAGPSVFEMGPAPAEGPSIWMQTPPEVRQFVRRVVGERRASQRAAETDPLTQAGNRLAWNRARGTAEADPGQAIVTFDVNNLKAANDLVGHEFGDQMIARVAQVAQSTAQDLGLPNRIFRTGGDEFIAIVPKEKAADFQAQVEGRYGTHDAQGFEVSVSGGAGATFDEADHVLRAAKSGRGAAAFRRLDVIGAAEEASALSKHTAIMESPTLAELSTVERFDDADVARAIVESNPGQVGIVKNVGDVAQTVRRMLMEQMPAGVGPQDFRVVRRQIRPSVKMLDLGESYGDPHLGFEMTAPSGEGVFAEGYYSRAEGNLEISDINADIPGKSSVWDQVNAGPGWTRQVGAEIVRQLDDQGMPVNWIWGDRVTGARTGANTQGTSLPASRLRRTQPKTQTDILVSSGRPITQKMVKEYEQHGMFSGQRARTADGNDVKIVSFGEGGVVVEPLHGGVPVTVAPSSLLPDKASALAEDMPGLYESFSTWAQLQLDQQAATAGIERLNLYGQSATTQLPQLMDEFVALNNVSGDSYYGATVKHLLAEKHMQALKEFTPPEDSAYKNGVAERYAMVVAQHGLPPATIDDLAAARGMTVEQGSEGGLTLVDAMSDGELKIPVADEAAAREFLSGFSRELVDDAPVTPYPVELVETPVGYSEMQGHEVGEWIDTEHETNALELMVTNAETGIYSAFGPEQLEAVLAADDMLRLSSGGAGSTPPPPPPQQPGGLGEPEPPMRRLLAGDQQASHGAQHANARVNYPQRYNAFLTRANNIVSNLFRDTRTYAIMLDNNAHALGITEGRYYEFVSNLENAHTRMMTQSSAWKQRVFDAIRPVRNRFLRDGTFWEALNAPPHVRQAIMKNAGLNPAERQAVADWDGLFHEFWNEVAIKRFPEMGFIRNYVTHMKRFEAELPGENRRMPGEAKWGAERRRGKEETAELEKDISVIIPRYFDGFFKVLEMQQPYEALGRHMQDPRIPEVLRDALTDWADARMWGLDPTHDLLAQGLHFTLDTLARPLGLRVTMDDVMKLSYMSFAQTYRTALGLQIQPIIRDLPQGLIGSMQLGVDKAIPTLVRYIRDPAYRRAMRQRALDSGWVQASHAQAVDADVFGGSSWNRQELQEAFGEGPAARREQLARVNDVVQDRIAAPLGLRGGIGDTWADALGPYGQVNDFVRAWLGESGYQSAIAAIQKYGQVYTQMPDGRGKLALAQKLLDESRVARYQGAIQRNFIRLIEAGDPEGAARFFGNEVANSQNRHGMSAHPRAARRLGPVLGRVAMKFNSFNSQTLAGIAQVSADPSISLPNKMGYFAQVGALQLAFAATTAYTGWNLMKASLQGIVTVPGNSLFKLINGYERVDAWLKSQQTGVNLTPEQRAILGAKASGFGSTPFTLNPTRSSLNPWQGAFREIEGVSRASVWGTESVLRNLTTGQTGNPAGDRLDMFGPPPPPTGQNPFMPQPIAAPELNSAGGRISGVDQMWLHRSGVTDPSRVYEKNGGLVYDTPNQTVDGKVPTHSLELPSGRQPGESWEAYERRVLSTPDAAFNPSAQHADSAIEDLEPETRNKVMAMIQTAAAQGVELGVVETMRPIARQEWLFKEGRSSERGGAPVTWTLTSSHSEGRAADLRARNPEGYQWIQQNAEQFGLNVLGSFDPGHVFTKAPQLSQQEAGPQVAAGMGAM